jgi:hypothetical protein
MRRLPVTALLLGIAGLIPFVVCALGALRGDVPPGGVNYWLLALCGYAAVILSFVGGVHWGFVLEAPAPGGVAIRPRRAYRLVLGVLPSLGGWIAILVMLTGQGTLALAVLIAGFVLFVAAESELRQRGLLPPGYIVMRWGLTVVVVLVLATVLTLRLIGARVSF